MNFIDHAEATEISLTLNTLRLLAAGYRAVVRRQRRRAERAAQAKKIETTESDAGA